VDQNPAIRTTGLTKVYGDLVAVNGLDLEVPAGSVFGLIGPNGAGKSTTFAILASILSPTAGRAEVAGFDPSVDPRSVRRHLGYMPDVLGVYDNLRVDEYLEFFAAAHEVRRSSWPGLVDGLLELVGLEVKREAMVESLSRGMKQRLASPGPSSTTRRCWCSTSRHPASTPGPGWSCARSWASSGPWARRW